MRTGRKVSALFDRAGGAELRHRLEMMPNEEDQRLLRVDADQVAERIIGTDGSDDLRRLLTSISPMELGDTLRDLSAARAC